MTQTIRINGVDVPVDQLGDGPSGEEHTHAMRQFHQRQAQSFYEHGTGVVPGAVRRLGSIQGSNACHGGAPPRLRKHKGPGIAGLRVK